MRAPLTVSPHPARCVVFVLLLSCIVAGACGPQPGPFDLLIVNGTVVDGSGEPGRAADVGIDGDRIVFVGDTRGAVATRTIDAEGMVVTPGFIDVHSHTLPAVAGQLEQRFNEGVVRMGVTTVVGGPDGGFSPENIAQVIDSWGTNGAGTNAAVYVGHNAVRRAVMGNDQRAPSPDELEQMKGMVRAGMEMGAVGLSTGLMYEPGMFSETSEVIELAKVVEPFNGIYDSHVRNPVHDLLGSDLEVIEIGRSAGIPAKLGHLKAVGLHNEGAIADVIAMVDEARARGETVVSDQYPYDGAATATLRGIIVLPPELRRVEELNLADALADQQTRTRLKESSENGVDGGFAWLKATGYSSMRITSSSDYPELVGSYLSELAEERGQDPFDLVAELILGAEDPVGITLGAIKEADVRLLMQQPWNMIASDGGYSDGRTPRGHPRSTGTFPRVLGRYVREWEVLPLADAVRKMTSLPAAYIGLLDRGLIAEGYVADITIFDPETIIDRSTWDEPHLFAEGVLHVLVSGVAVLQDGELTGETPGSFLTRQR